MTDLVMHPDAQADYEDAIDWYLGRSRDASIAFVEAVGDASRAIRDAPERWTRHDERHRFYSLRRFPFRIVYLIEPQFILVVAIAHSSREANYWRDRG